MSTAAPRIPASLLPPELIDFTLEQLQVGIVTELCVGFLFVRPLISFSFLARAASSPLSKYRVSRSCTLCGTFDCTAVPRATAASCEATSSCACSSRSTLLPPTRQYVASPSSVARSPASGARPDGRSHPSQLAWTSIGEVVAQGFVNVPLSITSVQVWWVWSLAIFGPLATIYWVWRACWVSGQRWVRIVAITGWITAITGFLAFAGIMSSLHWGHVYTIKQVSCPSLSLSPKCGAHEPRADPLLVVATAPDLRPGRTYPLTLSASR